MYFKRKKGEFARDISNGHLNKQSKNQLNACINVLRKTILGAFKQKRGGCAGMSVGRYLHYTMVPQNCSISHYLRPQKKGDLREISTKYVVEG